MKLRDLCPWCCAKRPAPESDDEARVEGRDAAVKCVNFSRHSNPTGMMREVLKEAELHRSVTHDRVVALYGVAVCRTQVLIAMELCGDSLHGLLFEARLRLGGGLRGRVMREVAEGMAFLHGRRVLHRDLKPENILVKGFDERAQAASCKLADFGLSTNTSASVAKSNLTLTAMIGTPLYMAPELMVAARAGKG